MKKKVPGIVTAIAILHFIGGGLAIILALCGLAQGAMAGASGGFGSNPANAQVQANQKQTEEIMEQTVEKRLPHYKAIGMVENAVDLLLGVLMVAAGIGLLQVQQWGRILSIVYACLAIPNRILYEITLYLTITGMAEAMERIQKEDPNLAKAGGPNLGSFMQAAGVGWVLFSSLFVLYPIFVLIVMFRPKVKAAFASGGMVRDRDEEEEEEESWGERRDANWRKEPEEPDEHIRPG